MLSGASPVSEPSGDDERASPAVAMHAPPAAFLLALFLVLAIALTFPNITRLRTYMAGDSGDSLLTLWIVRRVQIGLPHGWHAFWDAPIYYPARGTLAYSETLLPVALVEWPLRLVLGDVLAMNVIYLGSWVLSSWCVYRLAARFVRHWGAAFVAALAYTYAAPRLIHQQHFQLVVGGALVPLSLLLLLRLFDEPTITRGVLLGLSIVAVVLSASYFGALTAVVVVIVGGGLLLARRRGARRYLGALGAAAAVVAVLVAPIALKYAQLQRHPEFRRGFDPTTATHFADFAGTAVHNYVLDHIWFVHDASSLTSGRGIENRLFPGFVATAFGLAGVLVLAIGWQRRDGRDGRVLELALLALAGVAGLVLSLGDWIRVGGHRVSLPFDALRRFVPGFAGIRATARLELAFQLALAVLAAVGVDALLARLPVRRTRDHGLRIVRVGRRRVRDLAGLREGPDVGERRGSRHRAARPTGGRRPRAADQFREPRARVAGCRVGAPTARAARPRSPGQRLFGIPTQGVRPAGGRARPLPRAGRARPGSPARGAVRRPAHAARR